MKSLSAFDHEEDRVDVHNEAQGDAMRRARTGISEEKAFRCTQALGELMSRDIDCVKGAVERIAKLADRVGRRLIYREAEGERHRTGDAFQALLDLYDRRDVLRCMRNVRARELIQGRRLSDREMLETGLRATHRQLVQRDSMGTHQWKIRVVRSAENHVQFMNEERPARKRAARTRLDQERLASYEGWWDQEHPTPTDLQLRHQRERQSVDAELSRQTQMTWLLDLENCERTDEMEELEDRIITEARVQREEGLDELRRIEERDVRILTTRLS